MPEIKGLKGISFRELVWCHRLLDEVFSRHQEALLTCDGPRALHLFSVYRILLSLHIHHEDEVLLPVFRRIGDIKRWPAELFSGEHRKLEDYLTRIASGLEALGEPTPQKARVIIAVLDVENGLKRLLEHHDDREQQCLFPVLDQVTAPLERHDLLHRLYREFDQELRTQLDAEYEHLIEAVPLV